MRSKILGLSLVATCAVALAATPAGQQNRKDEFIKKFNQAKSIGSTQEMANAIRKYEDVAVLWIIETGEHIANAPNDKLFERMANLREAWTFGMKTDFVDYIEKYFSLLPAVQKRERKKATTRYNELWPKYNKNVEEMDQPKFQSIGQDFEGLAGVFHELGDKYYASQCWSYAADCFDETRRGKNADLRRATKAFGNFLRLREEMGLLDRLYKITQPRHASLVGLGYGPGKKVLDPTTGEEVEAKEATATAEPTTVGMSFEIVDDLDAIDRPNWFLDELHASWLALGLREKGSQLAMPRMEDGPTLHRVGASEAQIDTNNDGQGDVKIPMTGKLTPVQFKIGSGEDERDWGFLIQLGLEQDFYQDIEAFLATTDLSMTLYAVGGASMLGTVGGHSVRVIDEDMNGVYGGPHQRWGHFGLTEGHFHPEMDSVVIDDAKRAVPWSDHMKIGDQWYKLEAQKGGKEIAAAPVDIQTGRLKLKFKGPKPTWVIMVGEGPYEGSMFDLVGGGSKGAEVPAGRWSLYVGVIRKGKKRQVVKTLILPGENTPTWTVGAGETAVVELGGPFDFDFEVEQDEETVTVRGDTVVVTGVAQERYERPWNCVARPEMSFRVAGTKRGSKGKKLPRLVSQEELYAAGGYAQAWFPKDLTLDKKKKDEDVEVQLFEKKNKLFGKIESSWRQ